MMTEGEQHALREIESGLRSTDPELTVAFAGGIRSEHWRWHAILVLSDVAAVLMIVSGFLAEDAGLVLFGVVALAGLIGLPMALSRKKTTAF